MSCQETRPTQLEDVVDVSHLYIVSMLSRIPRSAGSRSSLESRAVLLCPPPLFLLVVPLFDNNLCYVFIFRNLRRIDKPEQFGEPLSSFSFLLRIIV